jgi:hypothetical protein
MPYKIRLLIICLLFSSSLYSQVRVFTGRYDVNNVESVNDSVWTLYGSFVDLTYSYTGLDAIVGDKIIQRSLDINGRFVYDRYKITEVVLQDVSELDVKIQSDFPGGILNRYSSPVTGNFPIAASFDDSLTYRTSFSYNLIDLDYDAALDNMNLKAGSSSITPLDDILHWDGSKYIPYSIKKLLNPGYPYLYIGTDYPTFSSNVLNLDATLYSPLYRSALWQYGTGYIYSMSAGGQSGSSWDSLTSFGSSFNLYATSYYVGLTTWRNSGEAAPIIIGFPFHSGLYNGQHILLDDYNKLLDLNFTNIQVDSLPQDSAISDIIYRNPSTHRLSYGHKPTGGSGGISGVSATPPIYSSGGTSPVISESKADASTDGYLASTDFIALAAKNTYNGNRTIKRTSWPTGNVGGATVQEFLDNVFFPFVAATISCNLSGSSYMVGTSQTVTISGSTTVNDETSFSAGKVVRSSPAVDPYWLMSPGGITSYSLTRTFAPKWDSVGSQTETYYAKQTTGHGDIQSSSRTISSYLPYLYGTSATDYSSGSGVWAAGDLTHSAAAPSATQTVTFNAATPKYFYFMYPASNPPNYAALYQILDGSLFDVTASFDVTTVNITTTGLTNNWTVSYRIYKSHALATVSSAVYTFKR